MQVIITAIFPYWIVSQTLGKLILKINLTILVSTFRQNFLMVTHTLFLCRSHTHTHTHTHTNATHRITLSLSRFLILTSLAKCNPNVVVGKATCESQPHGITYLISIACIWFDLYGCI
jgi:hypothetical protein